MSRFPTWPIAALGLILGFAVADLTGVRPLGGVVLVLAAAFCGLRWLRDRGPLVCVVLVLTFLAAFALSHPLGGQIGAWPSVLLVAAATGAVTYLLADRGRRRPIAGATA